MENHMAIPSNVDNLIDQICEEVMGSTFARCMEETTGICNGCLQCTNLKTSAVEMILHNGADRIEAGSGVHSVRQDMARFIDHTLLKPDATRDQIIQLCKEALEFKFASVCVNPCWVKTCAEIIRGSNVLVCSVVGFPLGANTLSLKAEETQQAVADGANEIDMVINIGKLKSGDFEFVCNDICSVVQAAQPAHVKVIIEACLLTDEEKVQACVLAKEAGAHFVKTSTGFSTGGATAADVALMRRVVGSKIGVKAAGGIRDFDKAALMVAAGASRIGASASIGIVRGE
jgi:deoxyribose-phosphate aldolase